MRGYWPDTLTAQNRCMWSTGLCRAKDARCLSKGVLLVSVGYACNGDFVNGFAISAALQETVHCRMLCGLALIIMTEVAEVEDKGRRKPETSRSESCDNAQFRRCAYCDTKHSNMSQQAANAVANVLARVGRYAVFLGVGGSALQASLYTVDGGERAVMYDRIQGVLPEAVNEGTHFRIPWLQTPAVMDVRTRPKTIQSVTGTKDLQMVNISIRMLSKPDIVKLSTIYKDLGLDWDEKILTSIGNEIVKAAVAQYNAEQLLTQRDRVSRAIRDSLTVRAKHFNVLIDDVAITQLSFGGEFTKAVEAKQVAQQDAERARFVVMKADQERKAAVIRAEGESESARLISDATRTAGPGLIELRRIEAAKDVASTLARSGNVVYLPNQNNMLLGVNPGMAGGR